MSNQYSCYTPNQYSCDFNKIINSCSDCTTDLSCCQGGCDNCNPYFLETQNRIYGCCASNDLSLNYTGICNTSACPVETAEQQSVRLAAAKMLTLKQGPNFIGTSQKMNYARKIKNTPGTYTFASKKYPYKQVNTGTNLSMVGSPQNWCTIQNPRSAQYESIGQNVERQMQCFTSSDVCVLPVSSQFVEFCYKKCLRPKYNQ